MTFQLLPCPTAPEQGGEGRPRAAASFSQVSTSSGEPMIMRSSWKVKSGSALVRVTRVRHCPGTARQAHGNTASPRPRRAFKARARSLGATAKESHDRAADKLCNSTDQTRAQSPELGLELLDPWRGECGEAPGVSRLWPVASELDTVLPVQLCQTVNSPEHDTHASLLARSLHQLFVEKSLYSR